MLQSQMNNPLVSIIISVFEQFAFTKRCLTEIEKSLDGQIDYEVLIVDDGSEGEIVKFLHSLDSPHQVFFNSVKKGFAKNNNFAASKAKGEFLCLLNNDCFVGGDWLYPMIDVFNKKNNVGMVGNVQRLAGSKKYDHMGIIFDPFGIPRHYGQGFYHRPFKGQVRQWSGITAACCLVKRTDFLDLEGFDEIFFNGCEDIDLCLRFNRKGYQHFVVHDIVVDHVRCASEGRLDNNLQNEALFHARWNCEIKEIYSKKDSRLFAKWYLIKSLLKLKITSVKLFKDSIRILFIDVFNYACRKILPD